MNNKRFLLVIRVSDIDLSAYPKDKIDPKSEGFKDIIIDYFSKQYGEFMENIIINIQNDIVTIEWVPSTKDDFIESELEQAIKSLSEGDLEKARFILEDLAFSSPKDPNILYNLGMCYSDLKDYDIAIDTLKKCVKLIPLYSNAHVALGVVYARTNKLNEAEIQFKNAIELDKNNSFAYRNLASILGKKGDNINALVHLKRAYEIDAFDPHTLYGLGLIYQNLEDISNATKFYKELVELGTPPEFVELAKTALREIAVGTVKENGFRTDAMFYCLGAMEIFENMEKKDIQKIAFEIGIKGNDGLDINDPSKKYTLNSLSGDFSGLQLLSYMYVGFKVIAPTENVGIDLSREYNMAKQLLREKWKNGT